MEKKNKLIAILCLIIVILVFVLSLFIINNLNKKDEKEISTSVESFYGTVLSYNDGYLTVKKLDDDVIKLVSPSSFNEGDFIMITYETVGDDTLTSIELVADKEEQESIGIKDEETTTTVSSTTTNKVTSIKTTSTKKETTTSVTITTKVNKDEDIINYMSDEYDDIGDVDKSTLKSKMITIIDFIFYDKEINGIKFKDLTSSAKAKVIYYALLIDNKIEELVPNYKEKISSKYKNITSKLIGEYLEMITELCSTDEDTCSTIKSDFYVLKNKINITWDIVKDAFAKASNKSLDALSEWYEIWSGK